MPLNFPPETIVHSTTGATRIGRVIDPSPRNFIQIADITTGDLFYRAEEDLTTRTTYKIFDYRLEAQDNLQRISPAQSMPWSLEVDATLFGLFLTFEHPSRGRVHLAIEIDNGNILIQPTRDPEIQPDLALRITSDGSTIESITTPKTAVITHNLHRPNVPNEIRTGATPSSI